MLICMLEQSDKPLVVPVQFVSANQVSERFTSMKLLYRKQAQSPERTGFILFFLSPSPPQHGQ